MSKGRQACPDRRAAAVFEWREPQKQVPEFESYPVSPLLTNDQNRSFTLTYLACAMGTLMEPTLRQQFLGLNEMMQSLVSKGD